MRSVVYIEPEQLRALRIEAAKADTRLPEYISRLIDERLASFRPKARPKRKSVYVNAKQHKALRAAAKQAGMTATSLLTELLKEALPV